MFWILLDTMLRSIGNGFGGVGSGAQNGGTRPPHYGFGHSRLDQHMTAANPLWGAPRIDGELAKPGIVGDLCVIRDHDDHCG